MNDVKSIEVRWDGKTVGRMALTKEGRCAFEYSPAFVASGVSVSPFELPLRPGVFVAHSQPFDGGFGVFDDCLPDGWGTLVLKRYLQAQGIDPHSLTLLQQLAIVGSKGRGALEFVPDCSGMTPSEVSSLSKLESEALKLLETDDYQSGCIDELMHRGGSPGGARPKVFVSDQGRQWLVKFRARYDSEDIGQREYHYSLLAKACGVEMPPTRLIDGKYFAVERFDRTATGRLHVISMAGLVGADYRLPSIDYAHIFHACGTLTRNISELWKVFRLMAFNYLIGNKDDHAKNFAFIFRGGQWHFAPAYDLLPSNGIGGYHTTSINNNITPSPADLVKVAGDAGLSASEALETIARMHSVIKA